VEVGESLGLLGALEAEELVLDDAARQVRVAWQACNALQIGEAAEVGLEAQIVFYVAECAKAAGESRGIHAVGGGQGDVGRDERGGAQEGAKRHRPAAEVELRVNDQRGG